VGCARWGCRPENPAQGDAGGEHAEAVVVGQDVGLLVADLHHIAGLSQRQGKMDGVDGIGLPRGVVVAAVGFNAGGGVDVEHVGQGQGGHEQGMAQAHHEAVRQARHGFLTTWFRSRARYSLQEA